MIYKKIDKCRICGNNKFIPIVSLGEQTLTGVFPKNKEELIESGPLELVKCDDSTDENACGLVQLMHNYDLEKLYGENYGYRSGLNKSMVDHLHGKVENIKKIVSLEPGDLVVDIGSNDSTLLQGYGSKGLKLLGIDPTAAKFKDFYPEHIDYAPEFFSSKAVKENTDKKAKVITSIAMFYDLENPLDFIEQIKEALADDGIWLFEQSYMPAMIDVLAYDTICHEHLEYYALKQIKWMTDKAGMKIIDVDFNKANGGSFAVTVAHKDAPYPEAKDLVEKIISQEKERGFSDMKIYKNFKKNIVEHKEELIKFFDSAKKKGETIAGYGASTKGNVILQFCGLSEKDIPCIAEVNEYKFGRCTPGTKIPIISEKEAKKMKPDYFLVLPWHFRDNIIEREQEYLRSGGKFLFPLPKIEIV